MELKDLYDQSLEIFDISDSRDFPSALMTTCLNRDEEKMKAFVDLVGDLSTDWMQKIYQYYLSDRENNKQDFTPASLASLIGRLTESEIEETVYDLCAGCGSLTIQKWNLNHRLRFVCVESDFNVIPFLLFNLAIRNIRAIVIHKDALQDEEYRKYSVSPGERFSRVGIEEDAPWYCQTCISNPPFNMKWSQPPFAQLQPRFSECELPPEKNANYAFVLTGLEMAGDRAAFILPNGIMTTNDPSEKAIIEYLVSANLIEAVIACPDGMFESTSIPTCILLLNKKKDTTRIAMLDMRSLFKEEIREQRGQFGGASHERRVYKKTVKVFSLEQIEWAVNAVRNHEEEEGRSTYALPQEIEESGYNLMPTRYIKATGQDVQHREYAEIIDDLNHVIREKNGLKLTMNETMAKAIGLYDVFQIMKKSEEANEAMNENLAFIGKSIEKENFISMTKNAGELKFENKSKDSISTILLSILQMWKQHVMYLNQEENRYLAELRDALLPDLMSGKINLEEET